METEEMYRSFQEIQPGLRLGFKEFLSFIKQDDLDATRHRLEWKLYCQGWWDGQRKKALDHHCWNRGDHAYHGDKPFDGFGHVIITDANRNSFGEVMVRQVETKKQEPVQLALDTLRLMLPCGTRDCDGYRLGGKCLKCGCGYAIPEGSGWTQDDVEKAMRAAL